ncbi:MAG: AAA family ATPase [Parvularculaceae bacterium]
MSEAAIRRDEAGENFSPASERSRPRARFRRLTLTDFRSYALLEIDLDGRPATFVGPNGAGKTNILEAVSLFGPGRGLRGARLDELPRLDGAGGWAAAARLDVGDDERALGVGATISAKSTTGRCAGLTAQRRPARPFSPTVLRLIWLTPAQDRLFMEGAGERRRFLDRMTLAHDPAHARVANDYETAMRQRQKLLDERVRQTPGSTRSNCMAEAAVALAAPRHGRRARGGLCRRGRGARFPPPISRLKARSKPRSPMPRRRRLKKTTSPS